MPLSRERLVPLIVAVALFMENMDSTVIATALPAIAADIGTNPLALKLAVTSYLLALAVFIPISGWMADRFGARTIFSSAIGVFVLGADGYGTTEITGGGLEHIVKQLGSAGTGDPLNQRASVGWKATKVAVRLDDSAIRRIETCSTYTE